MLPQLLKQAVVSQYGAEFVFLIFIEGRHRQAQFLGCHIEHIHSGFYGDGVCGNAEHAFCEGEEFAVPFSCGGEVAFENQIRHSLDIGGHDISDDAYNAFAADRGDRQCEGVVA